MVGGGLGGIRHRRVQQVQDGPGQHGQPRPGGQGDEGSQLQGSGGTASRGGAVAPGQRVGDIRHQTDGDGVDKGRRQDEQRHTEGVLAVQGAGGSLRISQRVLEGGHDQRLIQQGDEAHARRSQRNGDPGGQQLTEDLAPRRRPVGGGDALPPAQKKHRQHRQRQQGAGGNAGNGPGGAQ